MRPQHGKITLSMVANVPEAKTLSTGHPTQSHGRANPVAPSGDRRYWHPPHIVHLGIGLGTGGPMGFRIVHQGYLWFGWRVHVVSSVVSAYVRNVGRYPRSSHVDAAEELDQNIGGLGNCLRLHSSNHRQFTGEPTCSYGDVHHAKWLVDAPYFPVRMACPRRATWRRRGIGVNEFQVSRIVEVADFLQYTPAMPNDQLVHSNGGHDVP